MKRYYSEIIPVALVNKLQDAGIQVAPYDNYMPTYAEVLDWLMEKGYEVTISRNFIYRDEWWSNVFHVINDTSTETIQSRKNDKFLFTLDWFEATSAGIETALKMLKEGKK